MENIAAIWNKLILMNRENLEISDLDFSALSSWVLDCEKSFREIYIELLNQLQDVDLSDKDTISDIVSEVYRNLSHIKFHIDEAETGFRELLRVLEKD